MVKRQFLQMRGGMVTWEGEWEDRETQQMKYSDAGEQKAVA